MSSGQDMTLGELGRRTSRYGPYLALVAVVALVAGLAPGDGRGSRDTGALLADAAPAGTDSLALQGPDAVAQEPGAVAAVPGDGPPAPGAALTGGGALAGPDPTSPGGSATGGTAGGSDAGTAAAPSTASGGASTGAARTASGAGAGTRPAVAAGAKNCDTKLGRVKIPSHTAVNCVAGFDGVNSGASYRGVTKDTIKVAVYVSQPDAASSAITKAAGADDSPEQVRKQYQEWVDLYAATYETHGRAIKLVFVDASGEATDDSAARADAIKVAQLGVFASLGAPNTTYINELAARGIMCIQCAIDAPAEYYAEKAPYVYAYGMSSTWQSIHGLESIKKLSAGRKAEHAGDPTFQQRTRTYGLIAYDTPKGDYKKAHDFFVRKMKEQGTPLTVDTVYNGFPDTAKSQQQARPIIQKMKQAGVTTVIFSGDPFAPIFFTQEATRQQYFPEWSGSGPLVDTAFFARLYDQQQWAHAFSASSSATRLPEELGDSMRLLQWFYGRGPTAEATYQLIRLPVSMLAAGVHYAGEKLTPQTYASGQFAQPVRKGGKTFAALSYGTKLWPLPDYTGIDDKTFIYWDPRATGKDETGANGVGLYRYVDGGKRYLPGGYPNSIKLFDPAGTVTVYEDYPAGEAPPDYPRPRR